MSSSTRAFSRRVPVFRIREPRQIEAVASPARQEIMDALQVLGPCPIATLAEDLGRAPDSLYYHVRKLEQAGLVVQRGSDASGRRAEALYDVPGSRMVIDQEPSGARETETLLGLVGALLRLAERDLRAAFASGLAVYRRSKRRNAWGARAKGWLTPAELAELRGHLDAVTSLLQRGTKRRGTALHAVSFVLTPLAPSERSKATRGSTQES